MPKPLKFLTDAEIEERAVAVLDEHVAGWRQSGEPLDIDTLTECTFRFKVVWEAIDDPPGCRTFATILPTPDSTIHVAKLTLNERLRDFLSEYPQVERHTRGHELCHWVIHIDLSKLMTGALPFDTPVHNTLYHRASYSHGGLTDDLKNRLARFACSDDRAYKLLKQRECDSEACVEPAWMHRQAEHFSACLFIPRPTLYDRLDSDDPALYRTHARLAEAFGVSKRVVQIRLKKLGMIEEYEPGRFRNPSASNRLVFSDR